MFYAAEFVHFVTDEYEMLLSTRGRISSAYYTIIYGGLRTSCLDSAWNYSKLPNVVLK